MTCDCDANEVLCRECMGKGEVEDEADDDEGE